MNCMKALSDLRVAKAEKQKEEVQCKEIERQLEELERLRLERVALYQRLQVIEESQEDSSQLHPFDDEETMEARHTLRNIKENLAGHRVIGPCGMTIVEVDPLHVVVSFTGLRNSVSECFVLKISTGGPPKVEATTIPYFINAQSIMKQAQLPDLYSKLDNIGKRLAAYIHRKGDLEKLKIDCKEYLVSCDADDAVTSVSITLQYQDEETEMNIRFVCTLTYANLDATQPYKADITSDSVALPEQLIQEVELQLLTTDYSQVLLDLLAELRTQ